MKAVSAWTTSDGAVFTNQKDAQTHELRLLRSAALKPLLSKLVDQRNTGSAVISEYDLEQMLLDNAEELHAALGVKIPSNRGRKTAKAAEAA